MANSTGYNSTGGSFDAVASITKNRCRVTGSGWTAGGGLALADGNSITLFGGGNGCTIKINAEL